MSRSKLSAGIRLIRLMQQINELEPAASIILWRPACRSLCSNKEKEAEKTLEAAEAVKEGALKVKETADFVQKTTADTANTVKGVTKEISNKATDAAEAIKKQATDSIVSSASQFVKNKIKGK